MKTTRWTRIGLGALLVSELAAFSVYGEDAKAFVCPEAKLGRNPGQAKLSPSPSWER